MTTLLIIAAVFLWLGLGVLACIIIKIFNPNHLLKAPESYKKIGKEIYWQKECFLIYIVLGPISFLLSIPHIFTSNK